MKHNVTFYLFIYLLLAEPFFETAWSLVDGFVDEPACVYPQMCQLYFPDRG